jgi:transposase
MNITRKPDWVRMVENELRSDPRRLTAFDQIKELTALKCDAEFLREMPHHPLVQSVMDLHKAFKNFFESRAGFPKFRRKGETDAPLISISQLTKLRTCQ